MGVDVGSKSAKSEPNVVPLCDILLVLLIIFMVVTPMIQKGATVTLPEAKNTIDQPEPGQLPTVYIKRTGEIFFESTPVKDLNKLPDMITEKFDEMQKAGEKKVLLKADVDIEYGKVVEVMNKIKDAEIEVLGLITEKKASD